MRQKTRKKSRQRPLFREVLLGIIQGVFIAFCGGSAALALVYFFGTPSAQDLATHRFAETSIIYDRTGTEVLYQLHGEENRRIIPLSAVSDLMQKATVVAEDKDFYTHAGIDISSIARAVKANIQNKSLSQGGSTITQQLVRNVFLTREKSFRRKILEAIIAVKIERTIDKDSILELYLNTVPYGANAYGVEMASQIYFEKSAGDLSLDEAALLAAIPKATTYYSPYGAQRDELIERQRRILIRMRELGAASADDVRIALAQNTLAKLQPKRDDIRAPHFVFHVIEELERKYDQTKLETGGLRIITTIDMNLQRQVETIVAEGVARNQSRGAENAALVAIDPKSGEILALVGSVDFFSDTIDGQVNVAERPRSPGSSWKPLIYGRALEEGFTPETILIDAPTNFGKDGAGRDYIPRNYDGKFHGPVTMRQALGMSLNIPAVEMLSRIGVDDAKSYARRLGISTINDNQSYGLSFAIGGLETTLLDMTSAFSVYGNDGIRVAPRSVTSIARISDKTDARVLGVTSERVIDREIARTMNSILSDNNARTPIFGPRSALFFPDRPVAAKTGTSQEYRDGWTIGYTPSIAIGVWTGNNDSRPMVSGSAGLYTASPIWRNAMNFVLSNRPVESFTPYQGEEEERKRIIARQKEWLEKKKQEEEAKQKNTQKKKKR